MRQAFLVFAFLLLAAPALFARDPSFNAQNYKPATDTGNYLGLYGSRPLQRGQFSLGLTADYSHEPIILENPPGTKIRNIIGREIGAHLHGAVGILDWWDVGLLVSAAPYMQFFTAAATSETRIRMGDVLLNSRLRLVDNESAPVGVAFVPMVTIPTGNGASLVGNNQFTGGGMLVVESERVANRFSVALNAGYEIREFAVLSRDGAGNPLTTVNDLVLYGLGANLAVWPTVDLMAELRGYTLANDLFSSNMRPLEMDGGLRVYAAPRWAVTVGGGAGVLTAIGTPIYRAFAGLSYVPEHRGFERKKREKVADTDGDGIKDDLDRCPTEAGIPENGGCPPEPQLVITPEEFRVLTRPIHFDFGKATLNDDALPVLQTLVDALNTRPSIRRLSIEGHCDEIGTETFNQWLSEERAGTVMKFLGEHGVEPERMEMAGFGESRPADPGKGEEARARNRRVEFVFKEVEGLTIPVPVPPAAEPVLPESGPVTVPPVAPETPAIEPPPAAEPPAAAPPPAVAPEPSTPAPSAPVEPAVKKPKRAPTIRYQP